MGTFAAPRESSLNYDIPCLLHERPTRYFHHSIDGWWNLSLGRAAEISLRG